MCDIGMSDTGMKWHFLVFSWVVGNGGAFVQGWYMGIMLPLQNAQTAGVFFISTQHIPADL